MSSERQKKWREVSAYLDQVLDLEEPAREGWLRELSIRAPELAAIVRSLLAERSEPGGPAVLLDDATAALVGTTLAGQRLGAYTLDRPLGHGGMGTVWLAHRSDGRFEGRAAVKLLSLALLGRPAEQRFIQEGSVLAKLRHPNIAQLIDAGVAAGGQPYLVLEYVDGERIDQYAQRRNLDLEARVRLFLDVLAAVTHAHSQLVVHRDLKPANIFVDGAGHVKLLDFGVAALLGSTSELTREAGVGMTPEYAAPEQLLGEPISTATDVYALGLVLFVLLVGRHPLSVPGNSGPELARRTLELESPRVSQLAGDPRAERALRGDLDNIVAHALRKDPQERYLSADMFAQDLRRYLAHEPVSARPDSVSYRAAKFVRRHRGAVLTGVFTALAIVAAVIITTLEMLEARHQRDAALYQSKRAEYQARFAFQILSEVGSDGRPITIRQLVQKGIEVLEKNYGDDPRFVIATLVNISGRFMDLGDTQSEYATLVKAEKLARQLGDPAQIAFVQCNTVETELQAGRAQQAALRMRDGLANLARVADPSVQSRLDCGIAQARLAWGEGDLPHAIAAARAVATDMEAQHLQSDLRFTTVVSMLEIMLSHSGLNGEALRWNERATAALEQAGRADSAAMFAFRHNRAQELYKCGDVRRAYEQEKALANTIVTHQGVSGVPYPIAQWLGFLQVRIELTDAGLAWIERAVRDSAAQQNRPAQIGALLNHARAQLLLGRTAGVLPDVEQAESLARTSAQSNAAALAAAQLIRAQLMVAVGDAAAAHAAIESLLAQSGYPRQRTDVRLPAALILRARTEGSLGRWAEALQSAREALAVSEEHALSAEQSADVGAALMELARAQRALGDTAARLSAKHAAVILARSLGADHPETRAAAEFTM